METLTKKMDHVEKITRVMEVLCRDRATYSLRELERLTGVPKSTLHRILTSLERQEWVYKDPASGSFRPGIRFFLLNNRAFFYQELIEKAQKQMEHLVRQTNKTCLMSVLEGSVGLCIHSVEPPHPVKYVAHKGMAIPLHAGASGKVLLAFCNEHIRNRILAEVIPPEVDKQKLLAQLEEIRRKGYASSREEWIPHAGDISAPIFDRRGNFVAQIGVAGLASSFEGQEEEIAEMVKEAARNIGSSL
ncbi:MAG: hypothetical protein PWP05_407 [Thermovirga sp.]|jgi:DNA-binding IclR family transcriptional regulator|nr:hypothetical protein [Thermovirga sp.]